MANVIPRKNLDEAAVGELVRAVSSEWQRVEKGGESGAREALLHRARALVTALESPLERIFSYMLAEPSRFFASRMAVDLKLFETLAAEGSRPKSVTELAAPTGASPKLVGRIVRHLAAMKMVDQTGEDEYAPNTLSGLLSEAKYREGFCYIYDAVGPSLSKMPQYFEKNKLQNPEDTNDGPFQFAHNTPSHWVWIEQHPRVLQAFQDYLSGVREDRPDFMDEGFYPVHERLIEGLHAQGAEAATMIDVGGGSGHALAEFKAKVPQWPGRLVLQEQESVVAIAKTEPHASVIEPMVHDFFTPQPVHGARAYYMRYILHDWPDAECLTILKHLRAAMEPGYSRLLIHECVVADRDPSWFHTALDLYMMALFSTKERTEREWRELLAKADLRVTGIWTKGEGNLSIIEAQV